MEGKPRISRTSRASHRWKVLGLVLSVLALVCLVIVSQRASILTWAGSLLVVEDELMAADAIVVLVGGTWDREIEAAVLFTDGYAPRVVITVEPELPTVSYLAERGINSVSSEERRLQVLSALGVPRERVTVIRKSVTSTFDEARFVAEVGSRSQCPHADHREQSSAHGARQVCL